MDIENISIYGDQVGDIILNCDICHCDLTDNKIPATLQEVVDIANKHQCDLKLVQPEIRNEMMALSKLSSWQLTSQRDIRYVEGT